MDNHIVGPPQTAGLRIDLSSACLRPVPTRNRPNKHATFYRTQCPECGKWEWRRKAEAYRATRCRRCHCTEIAQKGFQATAARHGKLFSLRFLQQHRRNHPSASERRVAEWLAQWGVDFVREELWCASNNVGEEFHFLLDFVIPPISEPLQPDQHLLIQVQGPFHDAKHPLANQRQLARDAFLRTLWPGRMLELPSQTIQHQPEAAQQKLYRFLNQS